MSLSKEYLEYIQSQLQVIPDWISKRMFGGVGFFREGVMFAMVTGDNKFYLKINEEIMPEFEAFGMKAFGHASGKKPKMPYYECPVEVLEDADKLHSWAERSFQIAWEAKLKKKK